MCVYDGERISTIEHFSSVKSQDKEKENKRNNRLSMDGEVVSANKHRCSFFFRLLLPYFDRTKKREVCCFVAIDFDCL